MFLKVIKGSRSDNCSGMTYHFISSRGDIIVEEVTPHYSSFPGFLWVRRWLIYHEEFGIRPSLGLEPKLKYLTDNDGTFVHSARSHGVLELGEP